MIILGIDPDRGWALADHSKDPHDLIDAGSVKDVREMAKQIRKLAASHQIKTVRIERPSTKHVHDRPGQSVKQMKKIAHNVGENRVKAEAIYWFCEGMGLKPVFVSPVKNGTKLSAKQIECLTGWRKRTNEHTRDAIVLAWV